MKIDKLLEIKRGMDVVNMDVFEIAHVSLGDDWNNKNVMSSFTRVYMIMDGAGYIEYGGRRVELIPDNIYIVPAGLEFSYGCDEYMEKIYFHLSVLLPDNYDILYGAGKCFVFENKAEKIAEICNHLKSNTYGNIMSVKSYLYEIVNMCLEQCKNADKSYYKYSDYVIKILEYIDLKLSASLSAEIIADEMFTSPSKLRKAFKSEVGVPIGKYINDRIMFRAENEVRRGIKSIKEISDMLGFSDQFYFSRCFSEKYKVSPLKYRKLYNL